MFVCLFVWRMTPQPPFRRGRDALGLPDHSGRRGCSMLIKSGTGPISCGTLSSCVHSVLIVFLHMVHKVYGVSLFAFVCTMHM